MDRTVALMCVDGRGGPETGFEEIDPALSLALIGNASAEKCGEGGRMLGRGIFDKETRTGCKTSLWPFRINGLDGQKGGFAIASRRKPLALAGDAHPVTLYMEIEWQFRHLFASGEFGTIRSKRVGEA